MAFLSTLRRHLRMPTQPKLDSEEIFRKFNMPKFATTPAMIAAGRQTLKRLGIEDSDGWIARLVFASMEAERNRR